MHVRCADTIFFFRFRTSTEIHYVYPSLRSVSVSVHLKSRFIKQSDFSIFILTYFQDKISLHKFVYNKTIHAVHTSTNDRRFEYKHFKSE